MKTITGYNRYKKQGGIVDMICEGNNIYYGQPMNKIIIKHFQSINGVRNYVKQAEWIPFPHIEVTDQDIRQAAAFVKQNKALGIDAIDSKHLSMIQNINGKLNNK